MSTTKIEWADQTWNPITGCTPISEGCANCYAARMAKRLAGRYGYPKDDPFKPATIHGEKLEEPYHWREPQKVFVCSMGDLFHEDVTFNLVSRVWDVMFDCGAVENVSLQHIFMILTKRPDKLLRFYNWMKNEQIRETAYRNVWLGVTAENQRTADERIPILLQIPAAKRFVSVEPMLGPVDLTRVVLEADGSPKGDFASLLDWVIAGPETGPRARPTRIDWVRDLQRQCHAAGVPFFDKKDVLGETIQEWPQ